MKPYAEINGIRWSVLKQMRLTPKEFRHAETHASEDNGRLRLGRLTHALTLEPDTVPARFAVAPEGFRHKDAERRRAIEDWRTEPKAIDRMVGAILAAEYDEVFALCTVFRNESHTKFKAWRQKNPGKIAVTQKEHDTAVAAAEAARLTDKTLLSSADWTLARRMAAAVADHDVGRLLASEGESEKVLRWVEQVDDEKLISKAQLDKLIVKPSPELCHRLQISPDTIVAVDLKTTTKIHGFDSQVASFGYHGQIGHYTAGIRANYPGRPICWVLLAVQAQAPFDVAPHIVLEEHVQAGERWRWSLLRQVAECRRTGTYPGVAPTTKHLDLPHWAPGMGAYEEAA